MSTSLASLSQTTFTISFDPVASLGMRSAEVTITSDDEDAPTLAFTVNGYGLKELTSVDGLDNTFGASVAISGDQVLVAARDGPDVFCRDQGGADNWGEVKKLTEAGFGTPVAIDGDVAVIGNTSASRVYMFYRDEGGVDNWGPGFIDSIFGATLTQFGNDMAISGNTMVVGASLADVGGNYGQGFARVFYRSGGDVWGWIQELTASDGGFQKFFGTAVALSGDTILVSRSNFSGSSGLYFFHRDYEGINNWGKVKRISRSDLGVGDYSSLGLAVALSGDIAAIGVPGDSDDDEGLHGAVYILSRDHGGADNWGQVKKLVSDEGMFGDAVALNGATLIVGAYGAVHVFSRDLGGIDNWGLVSRLTRREETDTQEVFGYSVALSGETVVIGAPWYAGEYSPGPGAAYVWEP